MTKTPLTFKDFVLNVIAITFVVASFALIGLVGGL